MSKVTMPEPRWYAAMHGQALYGVFDTPEAAFEAVSDTPGLMTIDRLITTTQAEAYADARVREALEWASNMCDERAMSYERVAESFDGDPEDISELRSQAWVISNIGIGIRALIPPTD